jgi:beta-mannosidase
MVPREMELTGTWRAHDATPALQPVFPDPGFDDGGWAELPVPGHWRSTEEFATTDGPVLYRRRFSVDAAAPGSRRFVVLDGVFYYADAWLDGSYLGATEGYFFPHSLEVDVLDPDADHVLAIEVACPPQHDRTAKRIITGVFSHWDNLDATWNPGGLWRPVHLVTTGKVRLTRSRVLCTEASSTRGRLRAEVTLDAGTETAELPLTTRLLATVTGPDGKLLGEARRDVTLAAGDNHLALPVDVDDPPRWWPWRLGDQPLCDVDVTVEVDGAPSDGRRVRTAFREVQLRKWRLTVNGESMFPMGSNQGPTRMALAAATPDELALDVQLAVEANLDLLRIHAHVTRPELYAAADEAGLLLWQDFPLQWGYARGIRKQAVRQARAMVDLLGHHPSVAIWCAHNEPLAVDLQPGEPVKPGAVAKAAASMFLPTWNKDVLDFSLSRTLHRADPTRSVVPHSGIVPGLDGGGTDTHFYFGWYHGLMDGLGPLLAAWPRVARFVTEFGAQAVPETADFIDTSPWPDLDWTELLEHHACQKLFFDRYVPPEEFATFDAWRDASQAYQAALIQLQIEDLRRLKYDPTGGFCHFCFADGHPAVTWSVLDHARVPKSGYHALRDACRSVLPMLDPRTGNVHVASETRRPLADAVVTVTADGRRLGTFTGAIAADAVTFVGRVPLLPEAAVADVVLEHADTGRVENHYGTELLSRVRPGEPVLVNARTIR